MGLIRDVQNVGTLVRARLAHRPIPWKVDIMVTERCNLSCFYCYVDIARRRGESTDRPPDYSLDHLRSIIDQLHALGTRHVTLLGGEPLLRKDLADIVRHIKAKGMFVDMFTNGVAADKRRDALRLLDAVMISLEGREAVHDAERGRNAFRHAMDCVQVVRELGVPFRFNFTMTRNNIDELDAVVDLAREHGAMVTCGEATKNYTDVDVVNENFPTSNEIKRFWTRVLTLIEHGAPILRTRESALRMLESADVLPQDEIIGPEDPRMVTLGLAPCQFGRYAFQLSPDGVFYPCSKLFGRQGASIHQHGVEGAYRRMVEQMACGSCRMSLTCNLNTFLTLDPRTLAMTAASHLHNRFKTMVRSGG